jgi:serine protease Do
MTQFTRTVTLDRPRSLRAALLTCSLALVAGAADAQDVRIMRAPGFERSMLFGHADDRPMIGVTTASESERGDTLGLRIESVREGSPADKAGIKAGDRLQAANGVSLRADRTDAGEEDYSGVLSRRLQRAVQAVKPGESLTLRVLSGTSSREVRVTPVKASELSDDNDFGLRMKMPSADRAVLGVSVASTGSPRDTLGVFVQSVVTGGPAEKAGVIEGDRIAAVNGVSLRVSREDAEDGSVGAARAERLTRELAKLTAGDAVELTVITAGRSRTVRVTTIKASELPEGERSTFMFRPDMDEFMKFGPGEVRMLRRESPEARIVIPPTKREEIRAIPRTQLRTQPLVLRRTIRTDA